MAVSATVFDQQESNPTFNAPERRLLKVFYLDDSGQFTDTPYIFQSIQTTNIHLQKPTIFTIGDNSIFEALGETNQEKKGTLQR